MDTDPEIRRPFSSAYHLNQYQTNGLMLVGAPTIGGGTIVNIDRTNLGVIHVTIKDNYSVLFVLSYEFQSHVNR